jgi:hypothetical protein
MNNEKYEDLEKNRPNLSEQEMEEYLEKFYQTSMEKINSCSNAIKTFNIIGVISFIGFLILLAVRLTKDIRFSILYLLIPALVCVISFAIVLNMYLRLKDIFDEAEKQKEEDTSQIGSILTYFCLNTCAVGVIIYLILLSLKIENFVDAQWNIITMPFYLVLGILCFYWIFIIPAFWHNKLFYEMVMISFYLICGFTFTFMINFKLDGDYSTSYLKIFSVPLFALGLNIILSMVMCLISEKNDLFSKILKVVFLIFAFISLLLIPLKADSLLKFYDNWVPVVLFLSGFTVVILEKTFYLFSRDDQ